MGPPERARVAARLAPLGGFLSAWLLASVALWTRAGSIARGWPSLAITLVCLLALAAWWTSEQDTRKVPLALVLASWTGGLVAYLMAEARAGRPAWFGGDPIVFSVVAGTYLMVFGAPWLIGWRIGRLIGRRRGTTA